MKIIQIFSKTPNHKRFNYVPRHFDPLEEERQERERRIRLELKEKQQAEGTVTTEESADDQFAYRNRIAGSFKKSKKTVTVQKDPSAAMIRLVSLLVITVGLIGYLEFGNNALYATALAFIPFYIYLKFRKVKQEADEQ